MDLKVNDQVIRRRSIRTGMLIEQGSVVSINAEAGTARVHFPTLYKIQEIPLTELEPTSQTFGQVRVNEHPLRRTMMRPMR